jgi:two-component sensor histidine kinase
VVLTELLQNAVDHGFPEGSDGGTVVVQLGGTDEEIHLKVINDGRGLDPQFDLEGATGLGLSIVRTLVTTELNGSITMRSGSPEDFESVGVAGHRRGDGTVVELRLPR